MRVFQIEAPGQAAFKEIPLRPIKPDEAVVKVACSGICGTDLSFFTGDTTLVRSGLVKYPVRIGHEWSGVVQEVGPDAGPFKPGDRVVGDSGVSCGVCEACKRGAYIQCPDIMSVGTIHCWDGSFAEYIIMPARHLFLVPDSITMECAALIEPATIAYNGLIKGEAAGNTVAVIGTGPIGMSAVALARGMGAEQVVMIGRTPSKLKIAKELGATHIVNSTEEDACEQINRITGGRGAELVVEASGALSAVRQACDIAAVRGVVSLPAFYDRKIDEFEIDTVVMKELALRGVMGDFGLPAQVIELIVRVGLDLTPMITHRIGFEETADAFENCDTMRDRVKVMVKL